MSLKLYYIYQEMLSNTIHACIQNKLNFVYCTKVNFEKLVMSNPKINFVFFFLDKIYRDLLFNFLNLPHDFLLS